MSQNIDGQGSDKAFSALDAMRRRKLRFYLAFLGLTAAEAAERLTQLTGDPISHAALRAWIADIKAKRARRVPGYVLRVFEYAHPALAPIIDWAPAHACDDKGVDQAREMGKRVREVQPASFIPAILPSDEPPDWMTLDEICDECD
jgi:hypothetical protein